jgi:hypothetical protein
MSIAPTDRNTIYNVFMEMRSTYMDNSSETVGTYKNVHAANQAAIEYIIEEGHYSSGAHAGYELEIDLDEEDGTLHLEIETDGSMGGLVSVWAQPGRLRG